MSDYPKSRFSIRTLRVETELTEEDEGDPRGFDISLDDEAAGLILMNCLIHRDRNISFFVEQWPAIRSAVDLIAEYAPTHDDVMGDRQLRQWALSLAASEQKATDGGLEMALSQAAAMIERLNRERSQIKHGLQGLVDYLGEAERNNATAQPRAAAVTALRHAFNSAGTILKAMHESEMRSDQ